jgi:hypothetical protein
MSTATSAEAREGAPFGEFGGLAVVLSEDELVALRTHGLQYLIGPREASGEGGATRRPPRARYAS